MLTEPVRCQVLAAAVATSKAISLEGFQVCAGDTAARSWPPHPYSLLSGCGWEWGKIWKGETEWTIGNVLRLVSRDWVLLIRSSSWLSHYVIMDSLLILSVTEFLQCLPNAFHKDANLQKTPLREKYPLKRL